jgi:biopolymer transport protein ExbB
MPSRYHRAMASAQRAAAALLIAVTAGACFASPSGAPPAGLWPLFRQSFDLFTILLLAGSILAVAVIVRCIMDLRPSRIVPRHSLQRLDMLLDQGRFAELSEVPPNHDSFPARVVAAAAAQQTRGKGAMREAAELAAGEECARWFRLIEPLNVIGNLGPLIGLAGTVWGMILAFTSLGQSGGQAGPGELSLGISKALFHTLLGLCLAIPCLLAFGYYRLVVDRLCNRAMLLAAGYLERIPAPDDSAAPERAVAPQHAKRS